MLPILAASEGILDTIITFISTKGVDFIINLVAAAAIYMIGKWLARTLTGVADKMLAKSNVDETLRKFLGTIIYSLLLLVVIISALGRLGVNTTSFAAVLAAAGLAIGLALQGSLSNFASGVMIILFKPFKVGDFVEAGGQAGVVQEVHIFNTIIKTGDNVRMIVPNGAITSSAIKNYSAEENRRIDLVFGCGYDDDIKSVKALLEDIISKHPNVLKDPGPTVAVAELADSSVNFVFRPWVKGADYWPTRFELIEQVKLAMDEKGYSIPYPQQDVHMHTVEKAS